MSNNNSGLTDNRPTFESISKQIDNKDFIENWRKDRIRMSIGGMAAATLEYATPEIEDPETYFREVAEAVEIGKDRYTVFLKEPAGKMGYRALIGWVGNVPSRQYAYLHNIQPGYVALDYQEDASKLLRNGGWPEWYTGNTNQPRRIQGRHLGACAILPTRSGAHLGGHNNEIIYDRVPTLSEDAALQRRFIDGVEWNMREQWTQDDIDVQTDSLSIVQYVDGALINNADIVTIYDFARALREVNKESEFSGEQRIRGPYATLVKWLALRDTNDPRFADSMSEYIPDSANFGFNVGQYARPAINPEVAISAPALQNVVKDLTSGQLKIDDFGAKSIRVLSRMVEKHEEKKTRRITREETRSEAQPTIERLEFYSDEDARDLGLLLQVLSDKHDGEPVSRVLLESIISSPDREQIVARIGERIVGTATLNKVVGLGTGPRVFLDNFVTLPEVRGSGLGDRIWEDIKAWCQEQKGEYLEFTSNAHREAAHAFYKKRGATIRDTTVFRVDFPLERND